MFGSLAAELERTFELATLHYEASHNLKGEDWQRYQKIKARHDKDIADMNRTYRRDYDGRVEVARQQIIDERGQKTREHTPRFGAEDQFSPGSIERQAHARVRDEHAADLSRLEDRHRGELKDLLGHSVHEEEPGLSRTPNQETLNIRHPELMPVFSRSR